MRLFIIAIVAIGVLAGHPREAAADGAPDGQGTANDRFQLLVERNIFLRDRRPHRVDTAVRDRSPASQSSKAATVAKVLSDPASHFMLTGITLQGSTRTAFIEDLRNGKTDRFTTEATLAGGELVEIELDYIIFHVSDMKRKIAVGQRLTGKSEPRTEIVATEEHGPGRTNGHAALTNGSFEKAKSPAERMRERRQQQLRGTSDDHTRREN